jgi:hypothetical protein
MLPRPPLLPLPHFVLPTTRCCRHHHSPPLVDLQCASICVTIISFLRTSTQCIPIHHRRTVHDIPSSVPIHCSWELNESHIFNQRTGTRNYCIPVRTAYLYANIALFMLFPPAYQYAGVPELNENLIFKQHTSMHRYFSIPVHQHITLHVIL